MNCFMVVIIFVASISSCLQAKSLFSPRIRRSAVRDSNKLWPKATVVYSIKDDFSPAELLVINKAMNDISAISCIRFRKRTNEEAFVGIYKGNGCHSLVGYIGSLQPLSLGHGCFKVKTVIHELFHALGFYHEHARPDRDNFITVDEDNIIPDKKKNFNKLSFSKVSTLGLTYDYKSVMHYPGKSFSKNQSKTLKSKLHDKDIEGATEMSFLDILKINLLYRCLN